MCAAVAEREEVRAQFPAAVQMRQMSMRRPDMLPLSPQTIRIANACLVHWTLQSTPPFERPGLMRLALLANRDPVAQQVVNLWTADVPATDTATRAERWLRAIQLYWLASPRTTNRIHDGVIAQNAIGALGHGATTEYLYALKQSYLLASGIDSMGWYSANVETLLRTIRMLPAAERDQYRWLAVEGLYNRLKELLLLSQGGLEAPALADAYAAGVAQLQRDYVSDDSMRTFVQWLPNTFHALMMGSGRGPTMGAHPSTPLQAQHWFHRTDTTGTLPHPGVLSVIVPVRRNCGDACYAEYEAYRRLYAEFAPHGVEFILMTQTMGYSGKSVRLSPAAEVDSIRAYFLDRLKLPGMLGVEESVFDSLPDGRKVMRPSLNDLPSSLLMSTWVYVVLKSGIVVPSSGAPLGALIPSMRGEAVLRRLLHNQLQAGQ